MRSSTHRELLAMAALISLPTALALGACLGDIALEDTAPVASGGGGVGGVGGVVNTTAGGGERGCLTPPDGSCDDESDCVCASCAPAAACMDGGCMANGFCDLAFEDSCVCSDCDSERACMGAFGGGDCSDDGVCDRAVENCGCRDCFDAPTCVDNQQLCVGGVPDGECTPLTESCSCNDCLGAFVCLCEDDGTCGFTEPCVCGDCWIDGFCSDAANCLDDGICDWEAEGCGCTDCAPATACDGFP